MNANIDADSDPLILRKSTNLGITIAAIVTPNIIRILSVYNLTLLINFESVWLLKKGKSSTISKRQSICIGYEARLLIENRTLIKIVNPFIGRFEVIYSLDPLLKF